MELRDWTASGLSGSHSSRRPCERSDIRKWPQTLIAYWRALEEAWFTRNVDWRRDTQWRGLQMGAFEDWS